MIPVISPVATRVDRVALGGRLPIQRMIEVHGFSLEKYRLDDETLHVLEACDGTRTVADIGHQETLTALEARGSGSGRTVAQADGAAESGAAAVHADPDARADRLWDHARALEIQRKCAGKPGIVTEESKPSTMH